MYTNEHTTANVQKQIHALVTSNHCSFTSAHTRLVHQNLGACVHVLKPCFASNYYFCHQSSPSPKRFPANCLYKCATISPKYWIGNMCVCLCVCTSVRWCKEISIHIFFYLLFLVYNLLQHVICFPSYFGRLNLNSNQNKNYYTFMRRLVSVYTRMARFFEFKYSPFVNLNKRMSII